MKKLRNFQPSAAAFLLMMAMGTINSCMGFYVSPVCESLGIGRGSFGLSYSLMTAAGAFSSAFLGQYISRKGVKNLILYSSLWFSLGLILFSMSDSVWMFYGTGAAMGLLGTSCVYLCSNVIVQQSYSGAQASSLLGFVMAGSGVGGMVFSLVLPGVMEAWGWRFGYVFLALCWLMLTLGAFFLVEKKQPDTAARNMTAHASGMTREEAMKSPSFYLLMVCMVVLSAACGLQQQLPSLLEDMNFPGTQVGMLISLMTAGLAVGKIAQGLLYSKIGIIKGAIVMTAVFMVGMLLLNWKALVYPGLVFLAFGMGIVTTLMPMAVRQAFGTREFAPIWSILSAAASAGAFLAGPLWGMVYDLFGSYRPALLAVPVLLAGTLMCYLLAFSKE